jgi:hypothetical protein
MTDDQDSPQAVQHAHAASDAIRELNHVTVGAKIPATLLYEVLGDLKNVGHRLPQALSQLAAGLGRSLDEYDVYEDTGADPVQSIAVATDHLTRAAQLAHELGVELDLAQGAISGQGFRNNVHTED